MRHFKSSSVAAAIALCALLVPAAHAAAAQPFTADDLVRLKRISDPQVSPDGRHVAFVLRETDIDANRGRTDLWLLELADRKARSRAA